MYDDPIVREVREAGAAMAAEADYDVHRFFENLRKLEKQFPVRLARLTPAKSLQQSPSQDL